MSSILDIEAKSFEYPWNFSTLEECIVCRKNVAMVATVENKVVGYIVYELHTASVHLLNLAVAEKNRRQGIATTLVETLRKKLHPDRRSKIVLGVRESNLEAQLFFRSLGFRAVQIVRDYYDDTTDDCYRMTYSVVPQVQFDPKNRLASYFQLARCSDGCCG